MSAPIAVRVKLWNGRYTGLGVPEIELAIGLDEYIDLRARVAEVFPAIYEANPALFGVTASGLGMEIAWRIGLVEDLIAAGKFFPRWARSIVVGMPFEGPLWVHALIKDVRVYRPRSVTLKGCILDHYVL